MKLSNGVEWSLHSCVTLSQSSGAVSAQRLAELHQIPPAYLAKHLQALSRANIVSSVHGQIGGYRLARPPEAISLLDVVDAIDGGEALYRCMEIRQRGPLGLAPESCARPCAVARAMRTAEDAWRNALSSTSVADLAVAIDEDSGGTAMADVRRWLKA
jgi:Rrf2 family protein